MKVRRFCVIYLRVSPKPKDKAEESESIDVQEQLCREYAEKNNMEVVGVFSDPDVSGGDDDRDGYWAAIDALKRDYVLLAFKADRLYRSVYLDAWTHKELKKLHATIETVYGGPQLDDSDSRMVRQIMAIMDERFLEINSKRTSWFMRTHQVNKDEAGQSRSMSRFPPFGKKKGPVVAVVLESGRKVNRQTWIDDEDEQRAIPIAVEKKATMGYGAVAKHLNDLGIKCRNGKRVWRRGDIQLIVKNHARDQRDGIKSRSAVSEASAK